MKTYAQQKAYEIIQQDDDAHILKHDKYDTTAYVIFNAKKHIDYGVLFATDTPITAMIKKNGSDEIVLSMSDPDLRLSKLAHTEEAEELVRIDSTVKMTVLLLKGKWELKEVREDIQIMSRSNEQTSIQVACRDGETKEMLLMKYRGGDI